MPPQIDVRTPIELEFLANITLVLKISVLYSPAVPFTVEFIGNVSVTL